MHRLSGAALDGSGGLYLSTLTQVLYFPPGGAGGQVQSMQTLVYPELQVTRVRNLRGIAFAPSALAVDGSGGLYVADSFNNRVLYFPPGSAGSGPAGAVAGVVYGQPAMTTNVRGTGPAGLNQPDGVAPDGRGGLYVADSGNNRVLYFPPPLHLHLVPPATPPILILPTNTATATSTVTATATPGRLHLVPARTPPRLVLPSATNTPSGLHLVPPFSTPRLISPVLPTSTPTLEPVR
jgi:sugar lactone lactonase YvrE